MTRLAFTLLLGGLTGLVMSSCADEECTAGNAGCACVDGLFCGNGLTCMGGVCVGPGGDGDGDGDSGNEDTGSVAGGPEIISFTVTPGQVTEMGYATFAVQVTDPDGLEDIIGGQLYGPGDELLGAFEQVSGGTYTLDRTWEQFHASGPKFEHDGVDLQVRAEFIDTTQKVGTKTAEVQLFCESPNTDLCELECVDQTWDDDNCGQCGRSCECNAGKCP